MIAVNESGGYMNELKIFNNPEFGEIRTVTINNEPWFVAKDISDKLGYAQTSNMMKRVDNEDSISSILDDMNMKSLLINESGLYSAILGSKLESAKKFKRWVTSEVLPSIRKTGAYNLPQTYTQALEQLLIKAKENEKLLADNQMMQPKADFYDAVAGSKTAIEMAAVAKVLNFKGVGRNKLFEILRDEKVLQSDNIPYQKYIDNGWFRTIEQKYTKDGETHINIKTLVFQKGVDAIRKILEGR